MAGVRIEGHIGHDPKVWAGRLDGANRPGHEAFWVEGLAAGRVLQTRIDHRKQGQQRNAECMRLLGRSHEQVDALSVHARHGGDRLGPALTIEHKDGVDQVFHTESVLLHQLARPVVAAVAAGAAQRVGREDGRMLGHRVGSWLGVAGADAAANAGGVRPSQSVIRSSTGSRPVRLRPEKVEAVRPPPQRGPAF